MRRPVSSYYEDNLKTALSVEDDTGLPEHPIYSNFSRHLWTTHTRHGLMQLPNRSRENRDWPLPPPGEPAGD